MRDAGGRVPLRDPLGAASPAGKDPTVALDSAPHASAPPRSDAPGVPVPAPHPLAALAAGLVPLALAVAGCFQSELNGGDVADLAVVDDSAFVRFRTGDDYWVGLVVMANTGGQLYCPDFESADWIRMVTDTEAMILQLYEEEDGRWVSDFYEEADLDSVHFASGIVWASDLDGEDGRDFAFSREEALDPCLWQRLGDANAGVAVPYDHDVAASFTWWSEGIDLRGLFAGSAAAGYIRAVDCGILDVDWEIRDALEAYDGGC